MKSPELNFLVHSAYIPRFLVSGYRFVVVLVPVLKIRLSVECCFCSYISDLRS